MIVPHHDRGFAVRFGREGVHIRCLCDPLAQQVIERYPSGAARHHPFSGHQRSHPEYIQHRLVDAIRSQGAEPFEVILALELE